MQSSKSKLTIWGFLKSTGHQRNAAAVQRSVWLLFSRCVPAAHNEHQSGVVRVRVNVAEAWCRIQSFQDDLSGTWRNCEGIGSVGVMVHSLELTSGERELVPGKQQSTSKKAQRVFAAVCVPCRNLFLSISVPAGLWTCRRLSKTNRQRLWKIFHSVFFCPPSFLNQWVSCLRDSRSTNADDVKGAMGQKSERVQV